MINYSNIYKISGYKDFFNALSSKIIDRIPPNFNIKDVIILLPTQHSCFTLNKEFIKLGLEKKLPKVYSINDLSELVSLESEKLILSRFNLVIKINELILEENIDNFNTLASVTPISEYLANFIYKLELYQINLDAIIETIDENLSLHQQKLLHIIKIFLQKWRISPYITKAGWNNLLIENFSAKVKNKTVIVAGFSTNIPSIIRLMKKVSELENGLIVFYGIDDFLDKDDWYNIDATHGQYNFKQIFKTLNIKLENIKPWLSEDIPTNFKWLSESLKPAKSCTNWHSSKEKEISNWQYFSCPDQHYEAKAIIDILKNNQDKIIMIVTADESLMIKLILNLKSHKIEANIIRDHPLNKSNSAIWLNLCLDFINDNFSCFSALTLLKHKSTKIDSSIVTQIELMIRDKSYNYKNIFNIKIEDENFLQFISEAQKIKESFSQPKLNFSHLLKYHLEFAEIIAKESLWQDVEGEELKKFFDKLQEIAGSLGYLSSKEYSQILNHLLKSAYYRQANSNHSITLLKPIDSRLHKAELMILAGMNENIWPSKAAIDPCFNPILLKKIGLPNFEDSIGEEAYDFQCLAQAKQVIITRSEKISGTTTICSRWLLRILTLARKMNVDIKCNLKFKKSSIPIIENFVTSPIPPLEYRPIKLSATQIDKIVFNPYHIYTDLVLKLKKLPDFKRELSSLDFGIFVHKALELYNNSPKKGKLEYLLASGKQALSELNLNYDQLELIYWSRFVRIAKWFIENNNQNNKIYLEIPGKLKLTNDFMLTARADRIEISQDNQIHIIDYKTGRLSSLKSILSGKNLQLLLEGVIAKNNGFYFQKPEQALGSLTYLQLSGGENPVETLEIDIDSNQIIEKTDEYIHKLIEDYQNPITPYYYTKKKKLGYCEYAHLARIFD